MQMFFLFLDIHPSGKKNPDKDKFFPGVLVPAEKQKMATKGVPRARIRVSTPELAIAFRGESVSGHPGARGGPKSHKIAPRSFPKN